ncbi:MAG TPA: collagen-like protein [Sorangium sp.]|nr:collagen-like protein [Sorangium sp.]
MNRLAWMGACVGIAALVTACGGTAGKDGEAGAPGEAGIDGQDGKDGIHCWDDNENGSCDTGVEDSNGDGACDVKDCGGVGPAGPPGLQGLPGKDGSVKASMHAGYDIAANGFPSPMTSTTSTMWNWSNYGGAPVTIASGDKVFVNVRTNVYKNDSATTNNLYIDIHPCYTTATDFSNPKSPGTRGSSWARVQSTGINDQAFVSASYEWKNLSAGSYYFSLCLARVSGGTTYANFSIYAPKVDVHVY